MWAVGRRFNNTTLSQVKVVPGLVTEDVQILDVKYLQYFSISNLSLEMVYVTCC